MLDRWTAGIPRERVHLVTVPPPGSSPTLLWERFAGLFGLDVEEFAPTERVNASLGSGGDPARWLSPRQRTLAGEIDAAFRRDPGRVARLERPASIAALPAYERDLRAALARGVRAGG